MRIVVSVVFLVTSLSATTAGAQNQCLELVRLSRMKTQTIMTRSQFASEVNAYCDERSDRNVEGGSAGLSGYFSASASRAEMSYGKFCSKAAGDRGSESDYSEYMEGVQPGAYAAYAACTAALESDGIQFEMSEAPTRDRLALAVYNRTNISNATADIQWSGSDPVTCQWAGDQADSAARTLQPNERVFLECRRSRFDSEPLLDSDAVNLFRPDGGTAPQLHIPWPKYGSTNTPVTTLQEIRRQLDAEVATLLTEVYRLKEEVNELTTRTLVQTDVIKIDESNRRPINSGRGLRYVSGAIEFNPPFRSPPEVAISVAAWNIPRNARVRAVVVEVDESGFSYRIETWGDTVVHSIEATWIAVAKTVGG